MRKIKRTLTVFLLVVATVLPFLSVGVTALALPNPYENTFVGALDDKYELLKSTEGEKIVVIGGSSVAFGIESEIIEKYAEMPVVNFGLYAALGTRLMMELAEDHIGEGDIVILTPELDSQTLSTYFSSEQTLMAIDGSPELFGELSADSKLSALGGLFKHTAKKLEYYLDSRVENPDGVYNAKNFDEHGDLRYDRAENIMPVYRDENNMISLTKSTVSDDFIEYVNDYAKHCDRVGATLYFGFCPVNEMGLSKETDYAALREFEDYLRASLDCEIIGNIHSSVLEAGYFYDTNFHLNEAGAVKYSVNLTKEILLKQGSIRSVKEEVPEAPPLPEIDTLLEYYDENEAYFLFSMLPDRSYEIVGLTELGKSCKTLTVPRAYNLRRVTVLGASALVGGCVEKLIITEDTSLYRLADGCFDGADSLGALYIEYAYADMLKPPASFKGASDSLVVYIPNGSSYPGDYYWSERGLKFKIIEE